MATKGGDMLRIQGAWYTRRGWGPKLARKTQGFAALGRRVVYVISMARFKGLQSTGRPLMKSIMLVLFPPYSVFDTIPCIHKTSYIPTKFLMYMTHLTSIKEKL
jgi:hypothetical protein